ncbi:long-chain fatty acid--CoA ligase [Undibacterium sp. SXout11W]|uniref:long-chain fatty acid--CoA ligase n=1 Tax=Undibacterium sp. SXout11W TaxID=3413050 RepID=UPI003BF2FD66
MNTSHYAHWPPGLPYHLIAPATSVYQNLQISALRYPNKPALIFYDSILSYRQLNDEVLALAAYLQQVCGVKKGDRVLLNMQNSVQFVISFYAILRADAMVVPVNPMLMQDELVHYITDSGARTAIVAQEVVPRLINLLHSSHLKHIIVSTYSDYLTNETSLTIPEFIRAPADVPQQTGIAAWKDAIATRLTPAEHVAGSDDLACMPYTSGTTGHPKGCIHTHSTVMFNIAASPVWTGAAIPNQVALAVLPFFHVTGMQSVMNVTIYCGGTLVILPRWDRDVAGQLITRYAVTNWTLVPSMMIDFLSNPRLEQYDISKLTRVSGGGAAMPAAVAQKLLELTGQVYMEGYGLSETMAPSHVNPPQRMKQQCLGIPLFNVDARVVDPATGKEVAQGEQGEIWIHGPQVFKGYWNDPKKTEDAFAELDGKRFFRSGDLGYIDEDGFFFFTDRLKRMINASGFKVWPAEVESMMYQHPAIQDCCIIASHDEYRGETVKAIIVKKVNAALSEEDIMFWAHEKMAAYKVPRVIEFVDALPKSATGKVMWRTLQEQELNKKKI